MSSSNSVLDVVGPAGSAPRGPAIDVVLKLGGGRYRTRRQRPPRGPPSRSSSKLGGGRCQTHQQCPLGGPVIDVLQQLVAIASIHCQRLPRGH
jgi:hypothetical protein